MNREDIDKQLQPADKDLMPVFDRTMNYDPPIDAEIKSIPTEDCVSIVVSHTPAPSEKTAHGAIAKKLVELIMSGMTKEKAMHTLGVEDAAIDTRELAIETNSVLLKDYTFPDEVRRMIVKAGLNKAMTLALQSGDMELLLKAAKQIGSDPDVGLNAPPTQVINISLDKVTEALNEANDRPEFDFRK